MKLLNLLFMQTSNAIAGAGIYALFRKEYALALVITFLCGIMTLVRHLITNGKTDLYTQEEFENVSKELETTNQYKEEI